MNQLAIASMKLAQRLIEVQQYEDAAIVLSVVAQNYPVQWIGGDPELAEQWRSTSNANREFTRWVVSDACTTFLRAAML